MRIRPIATFIISAAGLAIFAGLAQAEDSDASNASLRSMKAIKVKGQSDACAAFEATYSKPLKSTPTAILDIEQNYGINGIVSKFLEVIMDGAERVRLLVKDPELCAKIRSDAQRVTITLQDGADEKGLPLLPEGRTFDSAKIPLTPKN